MKEFEILGHTSELKIRARGESFKDLFRNMMRGMAHAMQPVYSHDASGSTQEISIESQDINTLLVDFLSEILYFSQVNKEVYGEVEFLEFSDVSLKATIFGKAVESTGEDIKAVTYHGADVHKNPQGLWEVEIIYDI